MDRVLVTKQYQTFSALNAIFPSSMKVSFQGEVRTVAIAPHSFIFHKACNIACNASAYEINQLNIVRRRSFNQSPFSLQTDEYKSTTEKDFSEFRISYPEAQSLGDEVSMLKGKDNLKRLKRDVSQCKDFYDLLLNKSELSKEERKEVKMMDEQITCLKMVLRNSLQKFKASDFKVSEFLRNELQQLSFIESQYPPRNAIQRYVEKATAFLILIDDKYHLKLNFISQLALASLKKSDLIGLVGDDARYFTSQTLFESSARSENLISLSARAVSVSGVFADRNFPTAGAVLEESTTNNLQFG